ncbi:MAG: hypothetical protein EOP80_11835 [Variovorax sp.]|nr:MAG: hypothetical protein EOP80_11835 [Variovorax sp.]
MNEADLAAALERLMTRVDYYLHCELDEEYEHDRPDAARRQLEAALRAELLRASAVGLVSNPVLTSVDTVASRNVGRIA